MIFIQEIQEVYIGTPSKRFNWGDPEQDYDDMRSKYPDFNTMMQNGMQNYILRADTNRLVAFQKSQTMMKHLNVLF